MIGKTDDEDAEGRVQVDLRAMLPHLAERLRSDADRRFQREYSWTNPVALALSLLILGGMVGFGWTGAPAFCFCIAVGGVSTATFFIWRKGKMDRDIREQLGGRPRCAKCGYRLEGLESVNCPECGSRVRL